MTLRCPGHSVDHTVEVLVFAFRGYFSGKILVGATKGVCTAILMSGGYGKARACQTAPDGPGARTLATLRKRFLATS